MQNYNSELDSFRGRKQTAFVIIGNGFDLSHNLPTSYFHFSEWLIEKFVDQIFQYRFNNVDSNLLKEELKDFTYQKPNRKPYPSPLSGSILNSLTKRDPKILIDYLKSRPNDMGKIINSNFLIILYQKRHVNWFDVEQQYFKLLVYSEKQSNWETLIRKLNEELVYIKAFLIEYLSTIKVCTDKKVSKFITNQLNDYNEIVFIDFNYTGVIKKYLETDLEHLKSRTTIIDIHGSLNAENIVFGYGDDQNKDYQILKDKNESMVLEHFKTIDYIMDDKYEKYLDKLNNVLDFNCFVFGHSLGMTDKTLLQEIFDNPKCNKVHIYRRTRNDSKSNCSDEVWQREKFKNTSMSLLRIMTHEKDFRSKVVNFTKADIFPSI